MELLPALLLVWSAYSCISVLGGGYIAAFLALGLVKATSRPLWKTVCAYSGIVFLARLLAQLVYSTQAWALLGPGTQARAVWALEGLGLGGPGPTPGALFSLLCPPLLTGLAAAAAFSLEPTSTPSEQGLPLSPSEADVTQASRDIAGAPSASGPSGTSLARPSAGLLGDSGESAARSAGLPGTQSVPPADPRSHPSGEPAFFDSHTHGVAPNSASFTAGHGPSHSVVGRVLRTHARHQRTASNMSFTGDEEDIFPLLQQSGTRPSGASTAGGTAGTEAAPATGGAPAAGAAARDPFSDAAALQRSVCACQQCSSVAIGAAAVLWPGLASLAYCIGALMRTMPGKAGAASSADSAHEQRKARRLQVFVCVHVVTLYVSQQLFGDSSNPPSWQTAADILGLYSLYQGTTIIAWALQVCHVLSVHMVYLLASALASTSHVLLQRNDALARGAFVLVRNTAAVANSAALPLLTASVLCGIAMLEPTALGVQLLLLGLLLLTVSARRVRVLVRAVGPALVVLLLTWFTATFLAGALRQQLTDMVPEVLRVIGIVLVEQPPMLQALLACQLLAATCLSYMSVPYENRTNGPLMTDTQGVDTATSGPASAMATLRAQYSAPFKLTVWCLGATLIPVAVLLLGVLWRDALHAAYLVAFVLHAASQFFGGGPGIRFLQHSTKYRLLRVYAALHLVALYLVIVVLSPLHTAPSDPEPPAARLTLLSAQPAHILTASNLAPLRILGLDDVELLRDCVPVLGLLLLTTLHASLADSLVKDKHEIQVAAVRTLLGATARSLGHIVLGCLVMLAVCLTPGPIGVMSLAYLLLASLCMAAPPRPTGNAVRDNTDGLSEPLLPPAHKPTPLSHRFGSRLRWLPPALLSALAATDTLFSYTLFTLQQLSTDEDRLIPSQLVSILKDIVGLDVDMQGAEQAVRVLIPGLILVGTNAYMFWVRASRPRGGEGAAGRHAYSHGRAHGVSAMGVAMMGTVGVGEMCDVGSEECEGWGEGSQGAGFEQQQGWRWWLRRAVILHAEQAAALLLFGLALQAAGALGMITVVALGLVILYTTLAQPRTPPHADLPAAKGPAGVLASGGVLHVAQGWVTGWMLAHVAVQVPSVASRIHMPSEDSLSQSCAYQALAWLGLFPTIDVTNPSGRARDLALFIALLGTCAIALRARRWLRRLPWYIRAAAQPGEPCCLFWPPSALSFDLRKRLAGMRATESAASLADMQASVRRETSIRATGILAQESSHVPTPAPASPLATGLNEPGAALFGDPAPRRSAPGIAQVAGGSPRAGAGLSYEATARAQLFQRVSMSAMPVEGAVSAMLQPIRSFAAAVLSGLAEGTTSAMDALDIPHRSASSGLPAGEGGTEGPSPGPTSSAGSPKHYTSTGQLVGHRGLTQHLSRPSSFGDMRTQSAVERRVSDTASDGGAGVGALGGGGIDAGLGSTTEALQTRETSGGPQDRRLSRFVLLLLWLRDTWEAWGINWGLDAHLSLLLLAAFALNNALSLLFVVMVAAGTMRSQTRARARLWRWLVFPILIVLTVYQYAIWVGYGTLLPPTCRDADSTSNTDRAWRVHSGLRVLSLTLGPWLAWLGAVYVDTTSLWLLALAVGTAAQQVARDGCTLLAKQDDSGAADNEDKPTPVHGSTTQQQATESPGNPQYTVVFPTIGQTTPPVAQGLPRMRPASPGPAGIDIEAPPAAVLRSPQPLPYVASQGDVSAVGWYQRVPTAELETAAGTVPVRLIRPLVYGERQAWGALEWLCFYVLKFSFDALLVCVVLVCALQRDLVHAGYLALALLFFRKRARLQAASVMPQYSSMTRPVSGVFAVQPPTSNTGQPGLAEPVSTTGTAAGANVSLSQQSAFASASARETWLGLLPLSPVSWWPHAEALHGAQGSAMQNAGGVGGVGWGPRPKTMLPGTPFWMLPAFNLLVIFLQALYQAPLQLLIGYKWDNACSTLHWGPTGMLSHPTSHHLATAQGSGPVGPSPASGDAECTLPELLGFCKLRPATGQAPWADGALLFVMLSSETVMDLVLWLLLRLHAKLISTQLYQEVMQCVIEQQSAAQANRQRWLQDQAEAEARAALTAGLQQSIRAKRVAKLKGLFSEPLKTQGGQEPALFESLVSINGLAEILDADLPLSAVERQLLKGTTSENFGGGNRRRPPRPPPAPTHAPGDHGAVTGVTGAASQSPVAGAMAPMMAPPSAQVVPSQATTTTAHEAPAPASTIQSQAALNVGTAGTSGVAATPEGSRFQAMVSSVAATGSGTQGQGPAMQPTVHTTTTITGTSILPGGTGALHGGTDAGQASTSYAGQPQDGQQTLGLLAPARSGALRMRHAWEDRRALRASRSAKWVAKLKQAWDWLTGGPGSRRRKMWLVCGASLFLTISDGSVLALLPTLALLTYTLLAHQPQPGYWKTALVYAESLLVLQYIYLCIANCMCDGGSNGGGPLASPDWRGPVRALPTCSGPLRYQALHQWIAALGLHDTARACLPMFVLYLTTLMYTYGSAIRDVQSRVAAVRHSHPLQSQGQGLWERLRRTATSTLAYASNTMRSLEAQMVFAVQELQRVYRVVCQRHEVSRYWVLLKLTWPSPAAAQAAIATTDAQSALALQLTQLVNWGQGKPVLQPAPSTAAPARDAQTAHGQLRRSGSGLGGPHTQPLAVAEAAGTTGGEPGSPRGDVGYSGGGWMGSAWQQIAGGRSKRGSGRLPFIPLSLRLHHCVLRPDGQSASLLLQVLPAGASSGEPQGVEAQWTYQPARPASLAATALTAVMQEQTRLEQGLYSMPWWNRTQPGLATATHGTSHPPSHAFSQTEITPHAHPPERPPSAPVGPDTSAPSFQLLPVDVPPSIVPQPAVPAQPQQTGALPRASEAPQGAVGLAAGPSRISTESDKGAKGSGQGQGQGKRGGAGGAGAGGGRRKAASGPVADLPFRVKDPQPHAHAPYDLYAWTLTLDMISFIYAALFYQAVTSSSASAVGGLVELGDDTRTLPVSYLAALLVLFAFMVADRTMYTLGYEGGKLALHLSSLLLLLPWCLSHFWQASEGSLARFHVRVFLTMRCISWALGAQQLMWGYPPLSGYGTHLGRHATLFYRKPDYLNFQAYQIYAAVPFVYELRTLLDWTCTATTLDLYSWLKLEDIRASLFVAASRRNMNAGRHVGDRVPRYSKLMQGVVTLGALLLVLWLPPLLYSQGAPTYTTPTIVAVQMNVSITQVRSAAPAAQQVFPMFSGGYSYCVSDWGAYRPPASPDEPPPSPVLPPFLSGYDPSQIQLLCVAPASQNVWFLSPPARDQLLDLLNSTNAQLTVKWTVTRNVPVANGRGAGPGCTTTLNLDLAGQTREDLMQMVRGDSQDPVPIMRLNSSDPDGGEPGHGGPLDLWPLLWQARGEACVLQLGLDTPLPRRARGGDSGSLNAPAPLPPREAYTQQSVSCSLLRGNDSGPLSWWQMSCGVLDANGAPLDTANTTGPSQTTCAPAFSGPQAVVVLERVQAGFLGQTISSFGITGLYVTFVYGIARLLRLSIGNLHIKIPFEDLPSCRRLVTLCQDIYIARAQNELVLEEQLFRALINIYRNPQVLFELTRRRADGRS